MNESTVWIVGGAALLGFVLYRAAKGGAADTVGVSGTEKGGALGFLGDLAFGEAERSGKVREETFALGNAPGAVAPAPAIVSSAADFLSGSILAPTNGGSVARDTFGAKVRFRVQVNNTGTATWRGVVRLDVHEDYLFSDAKGEASTTISVEAKSSKVVDIDYALAGGVMLREPRLAVNLWAGARHLAWSKASVVGAFG